MPLFFTICASAQSVAHEIAERGAGRTENGNGRVTSMAARPNRAVRRPLSKPSPSRADNLAAIPWPSIC